MSTSIEEGAAAELLAAPAASWRLNELGVETDEPTTALSVSLADAEDEESLAG